MDLNPFVDQFILNGVAFIPVNEAPYGDHVKLFQRDGQVHPIQSSVNSYLQAIIQLFGYDMATFRKQYGQATGRKQLIPFPLSHSCTLVPFKTRIPIGNQTTIGWVIAEEIVTLLPKSKTITTIKLRNQLLIDVFHDIHWCERQLRNVVLVQHRYRLIHDKLRGHRVKETHHLYE